MPDEFTLESLAAEMSADTDTSDDASDDENAQPDAEAQSDEQDTAGEQRDDTDADDADEPEEGEEGDDEEPEKESSEDRVVKWKTADGTEHAVPEKELRDGYMRAQDYTQKTQNLARERETAESEIQKQAETRLGVVHAFAGKIGELHIVDRDLKHLESALQQTSREDDPARYAALQSDMTALRQHREGIAKVLGQADQLMQQQQVQQVQAKQQETVAVLRAEMPDLDSRLKTWNQHATETYGFTPAELSQVVDPRIFRLLDDATRFRELQARKPAAVEKAKAAPVKPAKQMRSVPPSSIAKMSKQFDERPSVEGLARLLAAQS